MDNIIKIHHVALVVEDVEKSLRFWRDALGMVVNQVKEIPEQKARVAFLPAGEGEIELVQPIDPESGLARFLEKKGEGMHHVCIQVKKIEPLLKELKNKGIRLINENAVKGDKGKLYAFVHPESTGGVLVELYQLQDD